MSSDRSGSEGLRFGLIGCGDIGRLRAAAIAATATHRLTAVSDVDSKRSAQLGAKYGAVNDRDWRTLLQRDDVDAIVVSTPPALHEEMCIAAMEAGKHVLCEKPLARSPAECRSMVAAAERTGRVLATGFNYRFYPSFLLARELLGQGTIGELSHVRSYGGYSATSHNQPWVHDAEVVGGGALHDIGIHLIDLTRSFLGEVAEVTGFATAEIWNYPGCEDNGFVLMRSPQGRVATLHASWTEWGRYQFLIELVGATGRIRASCFPMRLEVLEAGETGGKVRRRAFRFPKTFAGEHVRSYRWVVVRSFITEFDAFARRVRGEPSSIATGEDGMRAIEIACAVSRPDTTQAGSGVAAPIPLPGGRP
ncbi:MAG: Gfo/Idh/MocA family protein [Longimicrobiales bacterium]